MSKTRNLFIGVRRLDLSWGQQEHPCLCAIAMPIGRATKDGVYPYVRNSKIYLTDIYMDFGTSLYSDATADLVTSDGETVADKIAQFDDPEYIDMRAFSFVLPAVPVQLIREEARS